eukprot:34485-Hanusia_phi.AAC.2
MDRTAEKGEVGIWQSRLTIAGRCLTRILEEMQSMRDDVKDVKGIRQEMKHVNGLRQEMRRMRREMENMRRSNDILRKLVSRLAWRRGVGEGERYIHRDPRQTEHLRDASEAEDSNWSDGE